MARVMFDPENETRRWKPIARLDMRSPELRRKQESSVRQIEKAKARQNAEADRKYRVVAATAKAAKTREARGKNYEAMFNQVIKESAADLERLVRSRVFNKQARKVAIIQRKAVRLFRLSSEQLNGNERSKRIVFARQFVMYWACRLTGLSLPQLGRLVGDKDHTTIIHGHRRYVEKRKGMGRTLRAAR